MITSSSGRQAQRRRRHFVACNSPGIQNWVREELITGRIHLASQVRADSDPLRLALADGSWQQLAKGQPTPAQPGQPRLFGLSAAASDRFRGTITPQTRGSSWWLKKAPPPPLGLISLDLEQTELSHIHLRDDRSCNLFPAGDGIQRTDAPVAAAQTSLSD